MQFGLNYPFLTVFIIYILIIFLVGYLASKATKNISDYILAGRNLSGALTALGAGASDMSQWLLMALPGAFFVYGINQIWMPIGLTIGAFLNWQLVAKRLRIYTEVANNSLTIPAYFHHRFQDQTKILRIVTALVIIVFFTFYAAAGFVAGALLTQNIFHLQYFPALMISSSIIIIYTVIGGFVAISWIDFFQGILMFLALIIVPCVVYLHLDATDTINFFTAKGGAYFDAFQKVGKLEIISLLAWGLGYFGQLHIIVRFMAVRSSKEIPIARLICMTWMIIALYGALFTGILGAAYFHSKGAVLENPETIFLILSSTLFNPWIAGILIAAVLSAIMSTVSAQLLSSATALTEDLYHVLVRRKANSRELMITVRICVLLISGIAIAIAASPGGTILELVAYAWSGLGAAFGPVVLISLYWRGMTRNAAICGIITGTVTVIIWEIIQKQVGGIFNLYSILPGFVLNSFVIYLVGHFGKVPESISQQFAEALEQAK